MQRRMAVVGGVVALLVAAAPAAWATTIPFNFDAPIGPHGLEAGVEQSQDTGLVGVCDPQALCTGFRVTESTGEVSGGTTAGRLTMRGVVCQAEPTPPCSTNGVPFTGVKITERTVDTPEAYVDPVEVHVNFCLWLLTPQSTPYACDLPEISSWEVDVDDSGNWVDTTPQEFGFYAF